MQNSNRYSDFRLSSITSISYRYHITYCYRYHSYPFTKLHLTTSPNVQRITMRRNYHILFTWQTKWKNTTQKSRYELNAERYLNFKTVPCLIILCDYMPNKPHIIVSLTRMVFGVNIIWCLVDPQSISILSNTCGLLLLCMYIYININPAIKNSRNTV